MTAEKKLKVSLKPFQRLAGPGQRPGRCGAAKQVSESLGKGVNLKTVQRTVFKEGTPWERGHPLAAFIKKTDSLP